MKKWFLLLLTLSLMAGCVYRRDIQQGNIIAQRDVDKLRSGLTKNQVLYVLGTPVAKDSFGDQNWHYVYTYKQGKTGKITRKNLDLVFDGDKLTSASGDFDFAKSLGGEGIKAEKTATNEEPDDSQK